MKKKKIYKVGVESETYAISLVKSPAIEETLVALEEQKPIKVQMADEEKHMVYSAVLVPERPIFRRNEQGEEFYIQFTKESIEKMSQEFLQNYKQNEITLDHQTMANDITLVEQWIKADQYRDKSVVIGLSEELPVGSWVAGLKVNNIEAWKRIKDGSLRGFSVESLVLLEEFESNIITDKNNDNTMIDEMSLISKIKDAFKEVLASVSMSKQEEVEMEAETPTETVTETPTAVEEPTVEEPSEPTVVEAPKAEPQPAVEEPKVEEPKTVEEAPKAEEPKDNHLEDLIKSLKDEITALKEMNEGMNKKIKELSKQPSTQPININAKPSGVGGDNYASWREQMAKML